MPVIKITPRGILKPRAILDLEILEKKLSGGSIRYTMYDLRSCVNTVKNLEQPERDAAITVLASWANQMVYQRNIPRFARRESLLALTELGPLAGTEAYLKLHDAISIRGLKFGIDYTTALALAKSASQECTRRMLSALHCGISKTEGSWDWVDVQQATMDAMHKLLEIYGDPLRAVTDPYLESIRSSIADKQVLTMEITKVTRRLWRMYLASGGPLEHVHVTNMLCTADGCCRIEADADGVRFKFKEASDWEVDYASSES